jgi:hypothetical protein
MNSCLFIHQDHSLEGNVNKTKHNRRLNSSEINNKELGGMNDSSVLNSMNKDGQAVIQEQKYQSQTW